MYCELSLIEIEAGIAELREANVKGVRHGRTSC